MKNFDKFGLSVPQILLPRNSGDLKSWAVIACDQYTQDRGYWKKAEAAAAGNPSALNLILPEVYLNDADKSERIAEIHRCMEAYLKSGVFADPFEGFIYLERTTEYGRVRKGLIAAVDLETYEWKPFSAALIRATEATIPERIPPRMEIRRGAALELPHIMLLVNDPERTLVEACGTAVKNGCTPLYDGELMLGAGRLAGYGVAGAALDGVAAALEKLSAANTAADGSVFLFAVGDGNHSLATAKAVWDEYKRSLTASGATDGQLKQSPVRYALVEIVNIYDDGLTFEPIHRVLFNVDPEKLLAYCAEQLGGTVTECPSADALASNVGVCGRPHESGASFGFVYPDEQGNARYFCLKTAVTELAVSRLQPVLDVFLKAAEMGAAYNSKDVPEIDYIHGSEEVFRLGAQRNACAILLPPIAKESFFSTIAECGPLPRKSFSMGEASEKRFYLEARRLFGDN